MKATIIDERKKNLEEAHEHYLETLELCQKAADKYSDLLKTSYAEDQDMSHDTMRIIAILKRMYLTLSSRLLDTWIDRSEIADALEHAYEVGPSYLKIWVEDGMPKCKKEDVGIYISNEERKET